jgi:hypothetical protein
MLGEISSKTHEGTVGRHKESGKYGLSRRQCGRERKIMQQKKTLVWSK